MKKEELSNYAKGMNCSADVFDWIEKRVPEKYDLSEVEHILDYLASSRRPKRLERATYDQMKSNAAKWVKSLSKKGSKINEGENGVETVLDFGDGFRFVKLISEESYKREGSLMRHCVASYYGRDVEIFSLRDRNNNPHCTIEKDQQIKGKGNGDISPKYIDYVVRFLEWSGMKVRDSEMKNLGYEVVSFAEYIIGGNLYRERYIRKEEEVTYNEDVVIFDDLLEAIAYRGDKICLFKGYAYFEGSSITDLGQLASIGGYADFRNSSITDLGQLASIGGNAYFEGSSITDLGQLASIGGYADFEGSSITDLGQLASIGGNAYFEGSSITDLGQLASIGGNAYFEGSSITDLGQLASIGGYADFRNSSITDLGQLASIGGNAYFEGSSITDLGQLASIGGYADFEGSSITDLGQLASIGGYADFRNSSITDLGQLASIGGYAYFGDLYELEREWEARK